MGQDGTDFEKGDAEGTTDALAVLEGIVAGLIGTEASSVRAVKAHHQVG